MYVIFRVINVCNMKKFLHAMQAMLLMQGKRVRGRRQEGMEKRKRLMITIIFNI